MKMSKEHMKNLEDAIKILDTVEVRNSYQSGNFARADKVKDLDKRYRWDLFYACKGYLICEDGNYNMSHIDTALRRIVPALDICN